MTGAVKTVEEAIRASLHKGLFMNSFWTYLVFAFISIIYWMALIGITIGVIALGQKTLAAGIIIGVVAGIVMFLALAYLSALFCSLLLENACTRLKTKKRIKFGRVVNNVKGKWWKVFKLNTLFLILYLIVLAVTGAIAFGFGGLISVLLTTAGTQLPALKTTVLSATAAKVIPIVGGVLLFYALQLLLLVIVFFVSPVIVLAYPIAYIEQKNLREGLSRSWTLAKKHYKAILAKNLFFGVILAGIYIIVSAVGRGARIPVQVLSLLIPLTDVLGVKILLIAAIAAVIILGVALNLILVSWMLGLEALYACKVYQQHKK